MIVWFNCKITDTRLNPESVIRYNLKNDNRFDVARYSFASFAPLAPLVSKFIFNLELADQHKGREKEMEDWLKKVLPENKLVLHWYRRDNISQWRQFQDEINDIDDDLIFPAGNEDHIFLDSSIDLFRKGLEYIRNDPDPYATLMTSHWPESIRAAHVFDGALVDSGDFVTYKMPNNDAIRVMKRYYFDQYIDAVKDDSMTVFRTEHWNSIGLVNNKLYIPTKEQFRHFDGYAHVQVGPDVCPPLEIPIGFFEGMNVAYGYNKRFENMVNINPASENLYTVDPINGTDYKFHKSEFPAFWTTHIKNLDDSSTADDEVLKIGYDTHLLAMSRIHINWYHVGQVFDETNWPPASWLNNHTKKYLFTDE